MPATATADAGIVATATARGSVGRQNVLRSVQVEEAPPAGSGPSGGTGTKNHET